MQIGRLGPRGGGGGKKGGGGKPKGGKEQRKCFRCQKSGHLQATGAQVAQEASSKTAVAKTEGLLQLSTNRPHL